MPIELSATPASIRTAPPLLGEHTDEILRGAGLDAEAIRVLRDSAVI
jgi:crotonobetainyl-CoA:carnitine CoA-transferase CaiB-like acyl-CoA transferase